jgi:chromate reductase
VLRTASALVPDGVTAEIYERLGSLPYFDPDDDHDPLPPTVAALRASIAAANAVLFCTPEYAGALPGSFKNLLDWTVGGGETYGMPIAWVNASASPTGARDTYQSLGIVLSRTGADIASAACAHIPVLRSDVGPDGLIADPDITARIVAVVAALSDHAALADHARRAGPPGSG